MPKTMTRVDALDLLLLDGATHSPTAEEIKAAFRDRVWEVHPDTSDSGRDAASKIDQLRMARGLLLTHSEITPCKMCQGVGTLPGRVGVTQCSQCGGTGEA